MIELFIPCLPPSVNSIYRSFRGRVCLSKTYKDFQTKMKDILEKRIDISPMTGPIALEVKFHISDRRKHDLDNLLKALIDTLQPICFADDNQIVSISAVKIMNCESSITLVKITESNVKIL